MKESVTTRARKISTEIPWKSLLASARAYNRADLFTRIAIVKRGVPASFLATVSHRTGVPRKILYSTLGLARSTVDRKVRNRERLNQDESERIMSMVEIIAQAEMIVRESGDPEVF